ncbi:hypothetical protein C8A05DRAFT_47101 [Staphylotrichum tortipilum]|uniref:Borealin N-terminal domain-containing protein n=1 Tax=Staphylotrichum tortipilum TaxID=2831512 RepID=A0AAN6MEK0_9PEZI|nr:hypothetical protein C8A05DRAFT_47101 [Staphylotrichum longicolle]
MSVGGDEQHGTDIASQTIPTKGGSPHPEESPSKRQRVGITLAQKQALIDNLQLEITERARKLRANYNIHAQSLRTRIEIRVNRIPLSLRRLTMGGLLDKCSKDQQQQQLLQQKPGAITTIHTARGPPVPAKDKAPSRPPSRPPTRAGTGGDKENDMHTPQKKMRANTVSDMSRNAPAHVLSPTTSNSRVAPRPTTAAGTITAATPARLGMARPAVTPGRATAASSMLNKMVDGSRSVRGAPTPAPTTARKTPASSTATSTSSNGNTTAAAAAARRKRGATVSAAATTTTNNNNNNNNNNNVPRPAAAAPRPRTAASATRRRASGASESSDDANSSSSTGTTVVRRRPMTAPPGAQPRTTMTMPPSSSAPASVSAAQGKRMAAATAGAGPAGKKGTAASAASAGAGGKKVGAVKGGAAGTGTGRVLRKRG